MSRLTVTAIIPTYNRCAYLRVAIDSVLAQRLRPDRLIVVDDGSEDATAAAVASFGTHVEYVRKANGGKSSALNLVMPDVTTDAVWIFDDDDVSLPGALAAMSGALSSDPGAGLAYGSYDTFVEGDDGTLAREPCAVPPAIPGALFISLLRRCFVFQPGMLVRRHCYEAVGPFDEAMVRSQDYEMLLRLARRFRAIEVPGPLFLQRKHAGVRGTASHVVRAAASDAAWKRFDQPMLRRLHADCALDEFLPGPGGIASEADRFSALLERLAAMGRRGLWDLAAADLDAAVTIANTERYATLTRPQAASLRPLFDLFSDGAEDFAAAQPFHEALGRVQSRSLALDIRDAASAGLPYRIRLALTRRDGEQASVLLGVYRRLARSRMIARMIARKLRRTGHGA